MNSSSSTSLSAVSCPINSNTFPGKLWKLVNGGRFQSIGWSNNGSCIAINGTTFKNEVLYNEEFSVFKTQNFSSFVRQLNLYGFRKLAAVSSKESVTGEDIHHFQNPYFNRNRPQLLGHVRRAGNRRRGGSENAENSYFTTTPYRYSSFASGSNNNPQTLFHHQGITYAPIKPEPLHDVNNRFNPYCQPTKFGHHSTQQPQCYGRPSWGPGGGGAAGVSGLHGLTLIANTVSGSLTATCPSEPRQVDYPTLFNQQGQLKKFVVIQEDVGQGQGLLGSLQNSGISLSRSDNLLLSNSCDPMLCGIPQPSPPHHHQATTQAFIMSPPPPQIAPYNSASEYPRHGCVQASGHPTASASQGMLPAEAPVKVYTQITPVVSVESLLQGNSSHHQQETSEGQVTSSLPTAVSVSCGNIGALSNINTRDPSTSAMLHVTGN